MGIKTKVFVIIMFLILVLLFLIVIFKDDILYLLQNKVFVEKYTIAYASEVKSASVEFGVPEDLIYAIIKTESDFNPNAVSSAGAKGLMQLMPDTYSWIAMRLGEKGDMSLMCDVTVNIRYGTYYLSFLMERFENDEAIYASYNAGHGRVRSWLSDSRYSKDGKTLSTIPYTETKNYVKKVTKAREEYKKLLSETSEMSTLTSSPN